MLTFLKQKYAAIWVFVIFIAITQIASFQIYKIEKKREFNMVQNESTHVKQRIESALSQSNNATSLLAVLIEHDLLKDHFEEVAKELLIHNQYLDAIQLVQDMVIINTYPLKGNEQTIGYDLRTDNEHVREIMLSSSLNSLHFEGPFNLKQGGVGFVGRYPIIQHDSLWGYSAVVIKKQSFIRLLGLDSTGINETYFYQVKKQQEGKKYIPLFSNNRTDFSTGISHEQYMPIGDWIIQVKLRKPVYLSRTIVFSIGGIVVSLVFSLLIQCKRLRLD
ncbi:CHASE domain-containing protein [Sediminibacterium sp.]|uniref:CHASE domain-containing protein n=1 Tax=Sediminibacterium sp. TaxID=1917865 RepID=UPI002732E60B|nr:CHASE domain-containing protein [Sediminibacterium sp.]MDP3393620.1 CHASE domain-containing protein [Sediminibacterium sp.]MDP3566608.1 CHASE domain-containing protein [Sediminibacterium sp.]